MELWIRSQDKNALRRINTSLYLKQGLSNYAKGDVWFIVTGGDGLGEYKSKERALEVLDEIQNRLMPYSEVIQDIEGITISYKNVSTIIYEMPKE